MMTMLAGFIGDLHGDFRFANAMLDALAEQDVRIVYQVGDFGLWPDSSGRQHLINVNRSAIRNEQTMFIVLGNHEDYNRVQFMRVDDDGWLYLKDYPALRFAPRGHAWVDRGTRMAALGGAASIDRKLRTEGRSWWPQEAITREDGDTLIRNTAEAGWTHVDVMLTHEAPAGLHRGNDDAPRPLWFTPEIARDAWQQRVILREALDHVAPRYLVHGHWHYFHRDAYDGVTPDGRDYTCEVYGLDMNGMPRNTMMAELVPGVGLTSACTLIQKEWLPVR